ncbi:unnamed protein product [Adineta ricciae]|uniref:Uncharacterized protein n=1 Tax=Adineta ricciae TaxID=249248 RepID=A0A814A267_ADIRI|nr:unnamed protein product [Adineta ricciae]
MDETTFYAKLGKAEVSLKERHFIECEKFLSELIESDFHPEQAKFKVLLLHERVIVNYKLQHFDLVIQDAVKLREMGSAINWDDEIFFMEQQAIANVAIDQVVKQLEETKCEYKLI